MRTYPSLDESCEGFLTVVLIFHTKYDHTYMGDNHVIKYTLTPMILIYLIFSHPHGSYKNNSYTFKGLAK